LLPVRLTSMPMYTLSSSSPTPRGLSPPSPFGLILNAIKAVLLVAIVLILGVLLIAVVAILIAAAAVIVLPIYAVRRLLGVSQKRTKASPPLNDLRDNVRVRQVTNQSTDSPNGL